jgi:hypothetical protein
MLNIFSFYSQPPKKKKKKSLTLFFLEGTLAHKSKSSL